MNKFDLKNIKEPSFVKNLDCDSLNSLAEEIRSEIIKDSSINGGHLSSNLGIVEITISLYRIFDFPNDKLLFDVGHQCYTHKILTGRDLSRLNCSDGPAGFIKRKESVYDCFEAGHSSTALSAAEAFAIARDLKNERYEVVAVVGDSSLANGLSFEALNNIVSRKNKVIIVLNDNNMSISKPVGGLNNSLRQLSPYYKKDTSDNVLYNENDSSFNIFEHIGLEYIGPVNGHDIKALDEAFSKAKQSKTSVIVHAYTKKGKGYKFAEEDDSGDWHHVDSFDINTGKPINSHEGEISLSKFIGDITSDILKKNDNTVLITPAMIKGSCLEKAFEENPTKCFDLGISEEHAAVFAGSIAMAGIHPILCMYSTFLQRAYDEISHDCARINADMTILVDKVGLIGKTGDTHMGIYDEAFLNSIPNVTISMPSDMSEAKALLSMSLEKGRGVFAIRYLGSFEDDKNIDNIEENIQFSKWKIVHKGNDKSLAIIAVGPHGKELFERILDKNKFDGLLVNAIFQNPLDTELLSEISNYKTIILYDAYGTVNGFTNSVKNYLFDIKFSGKFFSFSLPNTFIEHDTLENQENKFGVSVNYVFDFIDKNHYFC